MENGKLTHDEVVSSNLSISDLLLKRIVTVINIDEDLLCTQLFGYLQRILFLYSKSEINDSRKRG